jgi:hypothetical protein
MSARQLAAQHLAGTMAVNNDNNNNNNNNPMVHA